MRLALLFVSVVLVATCLAQTPQYRQLQSFKVPYPGFLNFGLFPEQGNITLLISSFSGSPISHDQVSFVPDMGQKLFSLSSVVPKILTTKLIWPNEATQVPPEVFGSDRVVAVGSGFLVPGKSNGQISLFTDNSTLSGQKTTGPFVISQLKDEWFYHLALWYDMDKDGLLDCVTARATKPSNGNGQGELVWYKQPKTNAFGQPWEIFVLTSGPDIFIRLADLDNNGQLQIIAAEFFNASITVYWSSNEDWTDPTTIQSRVIDNTIGPLFDVGLVDLNGDGNLDLLATNHDHKTSVSGAFGYEIPQGLGNWKTQPWTRHTLASNIPTLKIGPNQASPGNANAFHPITKDTKSKPWIVLSGDGAEKAFMVVPQSTSASNWTYTMQTIITTGCTVGQIAVSDVNLDGYADFFVPAFEKGIVYGYTFSP